MVKRANKETLTKIIRHLVSVDVDPSSIFDVQIKRLHEYKRQVLNALHIVALYLRLKLLPTLAGYVMNFQSGSLPETLEGFFAKYANLLTDNAAHQQLIRDGKAEIKHLDYDWSLNDARK